MAYYNIDDADGTELTAGVSEHEIQAVAQRLANERGESVYYYEVSSEAARLAAIVPQIEKLSTLSANAWDMAVETAGPEYDGGSEERAESLRRLADACSDAYDDALLALGREDIDAAVDALETASRLESEGGDSSHADEALELLSDLSDESDMTEVEPDVAS
jgi:hypothetical protein